MCVGEYMRENTLAVTFISTRKGGTRENESGQGEPTRCYGTRLYHANLWEATNSAQHEMQQSTSGCILSQHTASVLMLPHTQSWHFTSTFQLSDERRLFHFAELLRVSGLIFSPPMNVRFSSLLEHTTSHRISADRANSCNFYAV